ncbi:FimD/PapC N-terminal domain-containing protein, partial [Edwardsiella tarda]
MASVPADASETLRFNPHFLTLADGEAARETDLSYFAVKGGQMPGDYRVSVWINDQRIEESTLHFVSAEQHPGLLSPCLSAEQLLRWGIALPHPPDADVPCHAFLAAGDSNLHEAVDLSQMAYRLTVPQAYLLHSDWLRTTPEQWQQGTPALQANYSLNGSKQGLLVAHAQGEHTLFLGTDAL